MKNTIGASVQRKPILSHSLRKVPALAGLLAAALTAGLATTALGQLQWSSYNSSGLLVSPNAAYGGDASSGVSVNFSIPAGTQLIFMTEAFAPIALTNANAAMALDFSLSADGGMNTGSLGRIFGMALFNNQGTPVSALDAAGYWCDFNTGNPDFEMFYRPSGNTSFFQYDSSHKLGTGAKKTGYPTNSVVYGMQFQLNVNSSGSGISIGTSSSTFAAAGAAMTNGDGSVFQTAYTSVNPFSTLAVSNFNEFAFMFRNTTTSNITVTVSGLNLVPLNPGIVTNPADFNGAPGGTAGFTVAISTNSATPLSFQWYEIAGDVTNALTDGTTANGSVVSGSTTNTLTLSNAQIADSGSVFVVVSNSYGVATSSTALLNIANDTAPAIFYLSLTSANLVAGEGTNVTVRATGVPAPVYFWYDNNSNLLQSGVSQTLTLANLQAPNAGAYAVVASNYLGFASTNFTISLYVAPCISQQPTNVLVNVGDPVNFSVTEGGCAVPPPTYQWYFNGNPIPGATATNYSIASVTWTNIGYYSVVLSNPGGSVPSASARLAIYSTNMLGTPLSPANGATGLCYDTPLYLSFNQPPKIGNTGQIRIYNSTNSATPVDTIDMSLNSGAGVQPHSPFPGDGQAFNYYPVMIAGTTAAIYPHGGVLTSNQTYYVTIDPGVILDPSNAYWPGISNSTAWQFTTKPGGPANPTNLVVTADNSGDFDTVQGAVDSVPPGNMTPTLINVRNGNYVEIVDVAGKNDITFRGQSRTGTVVGYPNNANIAPGGTTHARMAFKVDANDIAVENLTISNSTPQGGSQAEALMLESGASHFILNNATVASRQDTILANGSPQSQGYFYHSLVLGNFDYIWGGGDLFFTNCEIRTIPGVSTANLSAPRTDNGVTGNWPGYGGLLVSNGFSFVNCQLTRQDNTVGNIEMADHNGSQNGLTAWIGCNIDTGGYVNADSTAQTTMLLWEYGCSNLDNTVALDNTASPFLGCTQLNNGDPRLLAAESATNWLNGWQPQMAPNIVTPPANATFTAGETATLTVGATGIPDPVYQWLRDGTNVTYATGNSATLVISNVQPADVGMYSVIVSNNVGAVTSGPATLNVVVPTSPVMNTNSVQSLGGGAGVQFSFTGASGADYRVWATTNIALRPVIGTWTQVGSGTFGAGPAVFTDSQATNFPQRFYTITSP
jgi:Pectinesterase/Immunoglobulin domain/Bacterial Ig-like domain